ncbi:hypothetical protein N181_00715 [Sinorhizobium fredii USDA 205]|nr:hypothetical protein AOX55_0000212 [Sinorhizobium fredii CCBAU 25509]KSV92732.1 hypothetical protein N181_00715 [Sinorhizobium fredii USDA 205]
MLSHGRSFALRYGRITRLKIIELSWAGRFFQKVEKPSRSSLEMLRMKLSGLLRPLCDMIM